MKHITILLVLICIFCLMGCHKTENEIEIPYQEQEIIEGVADTDEAEEFTIQENYMNESDSQEAVELDDTIENINEYKIPEQSFDISLDEWGEVTFVSCKPSNNIEFEDASFYLIKDEQVIYKFPYRFENNSSRGYIGQFYSVEAVSFRDINNDKKDDIIIITYYLSGAGPTGMMPRSGVTIYLSGENEFYLAKEMIADVEVNVTERDRTIENIYDYLQ